MKLLTRDRIDELEKGIEVDYTLFNKTLKHMTDQILANDELISEIVTFLENADKNESFVYKLPSIQLMYEPSNEYPGHNALKSSRLHDFTNEEYFKRFLRFWKSRNIKVLNFQLNIAELLKYYHYSSYSQSSVELIQKRYKNVDYTRLYFQKFEFILEDDPQYIVDLSPKHDTPKDVRIN